MADFLNTVKRASQRLAGAVADTGAKTMLKTDVMFLERDIKARKQEFGIEIFDILQSSSTLPSSEIQKAFEACQADIQKLEGKVNIKKKEMTAIEQSSSGNGDGGGGGGVSTVPTFNSVAADMDEAETPGIPPTP